MVQKVQEKTHGCYANVIQWDDCWWLWAHEHCLAGYGFILHTDPLLSPN